jgi:hypothetical protein
MPRSPVHHAGRTPLELPQLRVKGLHIAGSRANSERRGGCSKLLALLVLRPVRHKRRPPVSTAAGRQARRNAQARRHLQVMPTCFLTTQARLVCASARCPLLPGAALMLARSRPLPAARRSGGGQQTGGGGRRRTQTGPSVAGAPVSNVLTRPSGVEMARASPAMLNCARRPGADAIATACGPAQPCSRLLPPSASRTLGWAR